MKTSTLLPFVLAAVVSSIGIGCAADYAADPVRPYPSKTETPSTPAAGASGTADAAPVSVADAAPAADASSPDAAAPKAIDCSTPTLAVTHAYKIALLRSPDAAGLAYWLGELQASPPLSRLAMLERFVTLPEFTTARALLTDTQFIEGLYTGFLGRPAGTAEVQYWLGQLAPGGGSSRSDVALFFVDSPEFADPLANPAYACFF